VNCSTLFQGSTVEKLSRIFLGIYLLAAVPAFSQDVLLSDAIENENVTVEQIDSALAALESRQGLDADTRGKMTEYLLEAQVQIQNKLDAEASAQEYAAALNTAPVETARLRATLNEQSPGPPTAKSLGIDERTTLAELQQMLATETVGLTAIESKFAELKKRIEVERVRPAAARNRISELRNRQEELATIVNQQADPNEQQILANARKLSEQLSLAAQAAEIRKLDQELLSHSVRMSFLQTQHDVTARTQLELNQRTTLLRLAVGEELQAAAVQAQEAAAAIEKAVADKHPVLRGLAEFNSDLTRELPQRAAAIQELGSQLQQTKNEAVDIEQRLARSEQWLEIGGLSRVLGSLMIAERRGLPQHSQYRADLRARNRDAGTVGLERIRVQEQRRELASIDLKVQELMVEIADDIDDDQELAANEIEIRELLRTRRDLLVQTENSHGSYLRVLGNLDIEKRHLLDATDRYQQFLAQNLLWIPSAPVIGVSVVRDGLPAYPEALSLDAWLGVTMQLAESIGQHVVVGVSCLALLFLLLLMRKSLVRQYAAMGDKVERLSDDSIVLTIVSLAIVSIRVLPVPFLVVSISWFLSNASQPSDFSAAAAQAMAATAPFIYDVLLFRMLSAPGGIFSLHFNWQQQNVAIIRRQLNRLATIGAPLLFLTAILFFSDIQSDRGTIGRLVFIALMVFFSIVTRPILHPDSGAAASYYRRFPGTWESRLRWVWFGIGVGLPLLLAVVSSFGFLYTSTTLAGLFVNTLWKVLVLTVVYMVVLRWSALARRKLALQLALKDRESRLAEKLSGEQPDASDEAASIAEVPLDLDQVDQQTRKLLQSMMIVLATFVVWSVWADVLPAFSFLNDVGLWTQMVMVDGVETSLPVTLADLLLAILIIVVTAIAAKNLPGLMEISILQRLTLAPGSRYAINTLVRYFVVTIGTFSVLGQIGWNWGQIQWLVAALSVGLGFGLQEIVATFISGLIILFERPVRVGDTVTVGELTGTVSRIRIRATTITDWDRKEILVPNKSFITEQVINWTLSDPITRVVIPVSVAYGSDANLTQKVVLDTLASLPLVLDEPPPQVYFTGFGDSSLNFTLHAYLRQLSDRLPLVHDVHEAVLKALRENGIEIPFPQRDIHIRSTVEDS
jgi:potassium efflux system protein